MNKFIGGQIDVSPKDHDEIQNQEELKKLQSLSDEEEYLKVLQSAFENLKIQVKEYQEQLKSSSENFKNMAESFRQIQTKQQTPDQEKISISVPFE